MLETETTRKTADGFTISAELGLTEFLNHPNKDRFGGEYVHVFPDHENGELRIYRAVDEAGGPKIMTTVPGRASIRKTDEFDRPDGWYLTGGKGETLLTLLRCFRGETTADELRIEWWPRNNSPNMDRSDRDQETLIVSYRTGSGREELVQMDDTYDRRSHMMATGDGYKF
jgi:hypothetical protein